MEKKKINGAAIAVAAVAVALVGIVAVLGVKMKNQSSPVPEAELDSYTYGAPEMGENAVPEKGIVESLSETAATVIAGKYEPKKANETTAPLIGGLQKPSTPAATLQDIREVQEEVTVPVIDQSEMTKGRPVAPVSASSDLPKDMSLAGLYRTGHDVIGLKEYIYNNDMDPNCTQRKFGYNKAYDWGAQLIDFSIDTVRMKFNYDHKDYMIQIWKGQYISGSLGTVGGEVGIYTREEGKSAANSHYNCAGTDDELNMELTILWDEFADGVYLPQLTRNYSRHWWQTGYVDGQLPNVKDSSPLRLLSHITFKDEEQATLFADALAKNGFSSVSNFSPDSPDTFKRYGNDVIFIWQYI